MAVPLINKIATCCGRAIGKEEGGIESEIRASSKMLLLLLFHPKVRPLNLLPNEAGANAVNFYLSLLFSVL